MASGYILHLRKMLKPCSRVAVRVCIKHKELVLWQQVMVFIFKVCQMLGMGQNPYSVIHSCNVKLWQWLWHWRKRRRYVWTRFKHSVNDNCVVPCWAWRASVRLITSIRVTSNGSSGSSSSTAPVSAHPTRRAENSRVNVTYTLYRRMYYGYP